MSHHLPLPNRLNTVDYRRPDVVDIQGSARLHFGFAVPSATQNENRRFGSIGMRIETPAYEIRLHRVSNRDDPQATVRGTDHKDLRRYLTQVLSVYRINCGIEAEVRQSLARHCGLGSGTQLALAAGVGACALAGATACPSELAAQLGRGSRSGIGVAAFEHGGLIVDGGRRSSGAAAQNVPPMLARAEFPSHWAIILIHDVSLQGKAGIQEQRAFDALPLIASEQSAEVCRLTMMQLLPAVLECDFAAFTDAVADIQCINGDYFAPVQGGRRYISAQVGEIAEWLTRHGAAGSGQTSWGPTGYVFCETESEAHRLVTLAKRYMQGSRQSITLQVTRGCNQGATVIPQRLQLPLKSRLAR